VALLGQLLAGNDLPLRSWVVLKPKFLDHGRVVSR
jgi:hypothetical protein